MLRGLNSATVDLIYLDPPFNSKKEYKALTGTAAEGQQFDDTWKRLRFSLRPETRELRLQLRHDRPLFKGQLALELSYAHNADHVPGQHRAQAGLGYRLSW